MFMFIGGYVYWRCYNAGDWWPWRVMTITILWRFSTHTSLLIVTEYSEMRRCLAQLLYLTCVVSVVGCINVVNYQPISRSVAGTTGLVSCRRVERFFVDEQGLSRTVAVRLCPQHLPVADAAAANQAVERRRTVERSHLVGRWGDPVDHGSSWSDGWGRQ